MKAKLLSTDLRLLLLSMPTDKLEGSALEICAMNEAYSWKALPFNDLRGTTDSNMPESRAIRSLHSRKTATLVMT